MLFCPHWYSSGCIVIVELSNDSSFDEAEEGWVHTPTHQPSGNNSANQRWASWCGTPFIELILLVTSAADGIGDSDVEDCCICSCCNENFVFEPSCLSCLHGYGCDEKLFIIDRLCKILLMLVLQWSCGVDLLAKRRDNTDSDALWTKQLVHDGYNCFEETIVII